MDDLPRARACGSEIADKIFGVGGIEARIGNCPWYEIFYKYDTYVSCMKRREFQEIKIENNL